MDGIVIAVVSGLVSVLMLVFIAINTGDVAKALRRMEKRLESRDDQAGDRG